MGVRFDDKFVTYSRDSSTGLDYAMNRYYGSNLGRYLTSDPYGGSGTPEIPQSRNRYSYVIDNPINKIDPSGLDDYDLDPGQPFDPRDSRNVNPRIVG